MLFKVTFVPDWDKSKNKLKELKHLEKNNVTEEWLSEHIQETASHLYSNEYNIFVTAENLTSAIRKLPEWFDDNDSCIVNHPTYGFVVWAMIVECVEIFEGEPQFLNTLAKID